MTFDTVENHIEPLESLDSGHYADGRARAFENRPLFDVCFERGVQTPRLAGAEPR